MSIKMKPSRYNFTLDLQRTQSQICLAAVQGDTYRELYINFSDGSNQVVLEEGTTASLIIERPDGVALEHLCDVVDDGAAVLYSFKKTTCEVDGLHNCQLLLTFPDEDDDDSNNPQLHSPLFSMNVAKKKIILT